MSLSVGALEANIRAAQAQIENPSTPAGAAIAYRREIKDSQEALDGVVGAVHSYASAKYEELRFGSAVESAFGLVRARVDAQIGELVPDALPMLATAFGNAASADPEQWYNAAAACRRLLKLCADALQPAGPDRGGRKMGESHFINRLVAWIEDMASSDTSSQFAIADLEHLGSRLDATLDAGHKGAHERVSQEEAARFIAGTYLLLGDMLEIGL